MNAWQQIGRRINTVKHPDRLRKNVAAGQRLPQIMPVRIEERHNDKHRHSCAKRRDYLIIFPPVDLTECKIQHCQRYKHKPEYIRYDKIFTERDHIVDLRMDQMKMCPARLQRSKRRHIKNNIQRDDQRMLIFPEPVHKNHASFDTE